MKLIVQLHKLHTRMLAIQEHNTVVPLLPPTSHPGPYQRHCWPRNRRMGTGGGGGGGGGGYEEQEKEVIMVTLKEKSVINRIKI